jgi:hypothetical protein
MLGSDPDNIDILQRSSFHVNLANSAKYRAAAASLSNCASSIHPPR